MLFISLRKELTGDFFVILLRYRNMAFSQSMLVFLLGCFTKTDTPCYISIFMPCYLLGTGQFSSLSFH